MSKKRKKIKQQEGRKKENHPSKNPVLKKTYLKILEHVCSQTDCETAFKLLSKDEKTNAFGHRVYVESLKFENKGAVAKDALKFFTSYVQNFYSDNILKLQRDLEAELTNFEILVGLQFLTSLDYVVGERKKQLQIAFTPMRVKLGALEEMLQTIVYHYAITANSTNIFNDTVYNLKFDFDVKNYPTVGMHYSSNLEAIPCRSSNYIENGNLRKVFQLGYLDYGFTMNWVFVPVKSLQGVYRGDKKELPLCIQNHAYNRLLERLKPLSGIDIIHQLSYTLQTSLKIEIYKGNILIPYFHINLKCGYFLGVINKNRLIIKTFLFLTHHYTPEGDKLEKALGLSKEEISYWKIGSLENFFGSNLETNHEMMEAFEDAGISHLFTVQSLGYEKEQRNYNWEALNEYINLGKTELFDEGAEDEMLEELVEEGLDE
ncbi:hypothetical protein [Labilibaculum antarcticum]|uniref:Uncharacterized protein n=1 Tax=Labilibaculum antarcticum TaxID=1717717 RepID=A0A1Y1CQ15_9BACT|nr:hypothetical protein [Labilibaculum antarcticum]BAX82465.1 hypothetical protein ALGA_4174 [Labilibaculum antarcticum]